MKILLPDRNTVGLDLDVGSLSEFGELTVFPSTTPEELISRIKGADVVICNKTQIRKAALDAADKLKLILLFATGYNNIDVDYARERGVVVCNAGQYSTYAVAQHTFSLILNAMSRPSQYGKFVEDGGWIRSPLFSAFEYPIHELYGKTLGIVGYGSIGRTVADIALAFGMNVITYTRTKKDDDRVKFVDFDTLLADSDVITVHCPLTDKTSGMFDEKAFAKCKDGAFFVNTSRGGVVVETALANALNSGKLSGAGLDVLAVEPMSPTCPLIGADNLTVTPHTAWTPIETRIRLLGIVKDNFRAYLDGKPKNRVN